MLATAPDKSGIVRPTPLYDWLYEVAGDIKPVMIGIASSANVFAGNENVRTEVQQFIRLLRRIAGVAHGTVLLVTQPSLTGIENKSASHEGLAGTTQWHNGERARAVMKAVKPEDGIDTGLRAITFHKNQSRAGERHLLRALRGRPVPAGRRHVDPDAAERAAKADEVFVALLKKFTAQHQTVSHRASRIYAPTVFAEQPEAQGISKKEFARAMQRLLDAKVIEIRLGKPLAPVLLSGADGGGLRRWNSVQLRCNYPKKRCNWGGGGDRPAYRSCTSVTLVQPPSPGPGVARCTGVERREGSPIAASNQRAPHRQQTYGPR